MHVRDFVVSSRIHYDRFYSLVRLGTFSSRKGLRGVMGLENFFSLIVLKMI